jgi:hypothetical protein
MLLELEASVQQVMSYMNVHVGKILGAKAGHSTILSYVDLEFGILSCL